VRRIGIAFTLAAIILGFMLVRTTSAVDADTNASTVVLQSNADAAWEGLDGTEQHAIEEIGLSGPTLDRLVLDYDDSKHAAVGLEGSWSSAIEQDNNGAWGVYLVPTPVEIAPNVELPHTL
jgi:hypothetical protein